MATSEHGLTVEEVPRRRHEPVDVPEEWQRIGFSGLFWVEATLEEPDKADEFEVRLPDRVPFHTNSGWLALRLNREVDPPTVVLVRNDWAALVEAYTRRRP